MQLTVRLFGAEILHVELCDSGSGDTERDLSGGTLSAAAIEAGKTDLYLGFTNGRGEE